MWVVLDVRECFAACRMNAVRNVVGLLLEGWYAGCFECGMDATSMMVYKLSRLWYANYRNDWYVRCLYHGM